MMTCQEKRLKVQGLITTEIESAGFDYDKIEEWVDYVGSEDANLVEFEPCSDCEGDGYVMVSGSYFGGDRYDPPDADFEECEACAGSGEIDPADYMDKKGQYYAESFVRLYLRFLRSM